MRRWGESHSLTIHWEVTSEQVRPRAESVVSNWILLSNSENWIFGIPSWRNPVHWVVLRNWIEVPRNFRALDPDYITLFLWQWSSCLLFMILLGRLCFRDHILLREVGFFSLFICSFCPLSLKFIGIHRWACMCTHELLLLDNLTDSLVALIKF